MRYKNDINPLLALRDLVLKCKRTSKHFATAHIAVGPTSEEWREIIRLAEESKRMEGK